MKVKDGVGYLCLFELGSTPSAAKPTPRGRVRSGAHLVDLLVQHHLPEAVKHSTKL